MFATCLLCDPGECSSAWCVLSAYRRTETESPRSVQRRIPKTHFPSFVYIFHQPGWIVTKWPSSDIIAAFKFYFYSSLYDNLPIPRRFCVLFHLALLSPTIRFSQLECRLFINFHTHSMSIRVRFSLIFFESFDRVHSSGSEIESNLVKLLVQRMDDVDDWTFIGSMKNAAQSCVFVLNVVCVETHLE